MSIIGNPITVGDGGDSPQSITLKDVNFYDYDGTIVNSYTAQEFANLSALPTNPTHSGLTSQGWNWSLSDAKTYVASYGKLNIGQMYITDNGKTRLYCHFDKYRLSFYLGICVNGTATIDWGDNSTSSTVTGTSVSTVKYTQHTYSQEGDYVISITPPSGSNTLGFGNKTLLRKTNQGSVTNADISYFNLLIKAELGSGITALSYGMFYTYQLLTSITIPNGVTSIGNDTTFQQCYSLSSITIPNGVTYIGEKAFQQCYSLSSITIPNGGSIRKNAFNNCSSLTSITIPSGVTSIGDYAFYQCHSLTSIDIPSGVTTGSATFYNCDSLISVDIPSGITSIGSYIFQQCTSLTSITIPNGVTSIGNYAFYQCYGLREIHFKPTTPPTISGSGAFTNLPTDCKIYVPTGSLSAYTSASNYPSSLTYTYIEE